MRDDPIDGVRPEGEPGGRHGALRRALRRARAEAAERSDVVIDLRQAELGRLELLRDALAPVFEETPKDVDMFDVGMTAGERPRLFIDMVAFVEMGRDRRLYRFLRDGRNGRATLAESEQIEPIVEAITAYVARRLVERERLLADDDRRAAMAQEGPAFPPSAPAAAPALVAPTVEPKRYPFWLRALAILFAFGLGGGVGAAVVITLMVAASKGMLRGFE